MQALICRVADIRHPTVLAISLPSWLALDYAVQGDSYTFNRTVMLRTGSAAIALLAASFACTPVGRLFGWQRPTQVRRALGLYGFLYALLHVWNYAVLENGLDPALIVRDLQERPAMSVGLLACWRWSHWRPRQRAAGSSASASAGVPFIAWCTWPCRSLSGIIFGSIATSSPSRCCMPC